MLTPRQHSDPAPIVGPLVGDLLQFGRLWWIGWALVTAAIVLVVWLIAKG